MHFGENHLIHCCVSEIGLRFYPMNGESKRSPYKVPESKPNARQHKRKKKPQKEILYFRNIQTNKTQSEREKDMKRII